MRLAIRLVKLIKFLAYPLAFFAIVSSLKATELSNPSRPADTRRYPPAYTLNTQYSAFGYDLEVDQKSGYTRSQLENCEVIVERNREYCHAAEIKRADEARDAALVDF